MHRLLTTLTITGVGYRVRLDGLQPSTTYYTVDIVRADGTSIGVQSPVKQCTTPGPG
jgi:hypothetical protein